MAIAGTLAMCSASLAGEIAQTESTVADAHKAAVVDLVDSQGMNTCGSQSLTQSSNTTTINPNSVWCGDNTTNSETSLARAFIAQFDMTLKCVDFAIAENTGGDATVQVRVLVGSPSSAYTDLTLVSSADVLVADGSALLFESVDIPDVQIPAGSQFIIELNTPSRFVADGGDGGLISFGTNTLGQSNPTYLRGPASGITDFTDSAELGFGDRNLVMSLGIESGIAATVQGGFPMSVIGNAVMSQLGDELVIAGDSNSGEYGVAIGFGTAASGVGASLSLLEDNGVGGGTLAVSFMGETEVNTIQLSDYQGDSDVAVLELDFDDSSFDTFDVEVYENGVLVGILHDQSSGTVLVRSALENSGSRDNGNGWRRFMKGVRWFWDTFDDALIGIAKAYVVSQFSINIEGAGGESFGGDEFRVVAGNANQFSESMTDMEFVVSGMAGMSVNVGNDSPTVAIGDAQTDPHYDKAGNIVTAQTGVSFSSSGVGSDTNLTGEDFDGDGLADLVASSASGFVSADMMLGGVESASFGFDIVSSIWPPSPIELCPFGPSVCDGPGGCTPNPFGKLGSGPYNPLPTEPIQWTVNPDFTGVDHDSVAYEFFLDGVSVGSISDAQGMMGLTSDIATGAGTLSGDDYGFATYYAGGTTFTTTAGDAFEVDEIQMIAIGSTPPESLSSIQFSAGIGDEDAGDVRVRISLPETTLLDFNTCLADLSGDGVLNFFDVSAFLSAFAAQEPAADFTNDGVFNFFDVSAFLSAFAAGCP